MGTWLRGRLTYANVMATIAVFLALGGGAAFALSRDSVGARELGPIVTRSAVSTEIAPDTGGNVSVQCKDSEQVISGGNNGNLDRTVVIASRFQDPNGWRVYAFNEGPSPQTVTVYAYCLKR